MYIFITLLSQLPLVGSSVLRFFGSSDLGFFGSLTGVRVGKGQVWKAEGVRFGSPRFSVSVTAAIIDVAVIVTQIPINTFIMVFSLLNDA